MSITKVNADTLDLTDNYAFTGTITGAGDTDTFGTQFLHVQDQKTDGTQGGTSPTSFTARVLNTVVTNEITGASLASNQITIPVGTYYCELTSPHYGSIGGWNGRLYDTVGTATLIRNTNNTNATQTYHMSGRFTVAAEAVVEFQVRTTSAIGTNGLGSHDGITDGVEIYGEVKLWKVA